MNVRKIEIQKRKRKKTSKWNREIQRDRPIEKRQRTLRNLFLISEWTTHTQIFCIFSGKIVDTNSCGRLAVEKVTNLFASCLNAFWLVTWNLKLSSFTSSLYLFMYFSFSVVRIVFSFFLLFSMEPEISIESCVIQHRSIWLLFLLKNLMKIITKIEIR